MPRLAGDIPYRLLGGGQPTQSTNRSNSALVNPQSKSHHNASMFFDGVNDAGLIFGNVDLLLANAWTVMVWVAPGNLSPVADQMIYGIGPLSTPKINGIELMIEAGGTFAANLYNSAGTLIKKRSLAADEFFFGVNSWHQIALTWDGATMRVYRNGVDVNTLMAEEADIGGGQTNTLRSITLGSSFFPIVEERMFGLIHSCAHWSDTLDAAAITEIYNSGVGGDFDLNLGQGDYDKQMYLRSWYQLARTPGEALLEDMAPNGGGFSLITTLTSERVVNSAPEGSFFTAGATRFFIENPEPQGVGNAMTIAAWARPDSLPAEGVTQDVCRFTTLDDDNIALSITTSGGLSYWVYEVSDSTNLVVTTLVGTTPVTADTWYHILGCKNDTFTIRLFVNALDDITPVVAGIAVTTNVARFTGIAVDLDANNDPFDGAIDTIAFWDVPISEDSVKAVYNGGWRNVDLRETTPSYAEAGNLTQWWRFGSTALNEPLQPQQMVSTGYDITLPGGGMEQIDKQKIGTRLMGNCATFPLGSGLGTPTALPVGIADTFTISMWLKPDNISTDTQYPLYIGPEQPSTLNSITWKLDGDVAGDPFVIEVISSGGVTVQRITYEDLLVQDSWQNLTMVWAGSAITLYRNGTAVLGVVEEANAGSVIDSSRFVDIGGSTRVLAAAAGLKFDGRIGHVGFWNTELTPNSIRTVSSQANNLDLRYNKDEYVHAQYLQHYWKLGEDRFLTGRDFMNTTRGVGLLPLTTETGNVPVDGDSPEAIFFVPGHLKSVAFDGTEQFRNETEQSIGIADSWTLAWWSRATLDFSAPFTPQSLLNLNDPGDYRSGINIYMLNPAGGLSLVTYDDLAGPNILKWYQLQNVWNDNDWHHVAITWDGTDLEIYVDAVQEAPSAKVMDNVGSMNDFPRRIGYGGDVIGIPSDDWSGSLGHLAIWSTPLNLANIKEIFDGSHSIDLDSNFGNYIQSGTLEHYWRPGFADPGFTDEAPLASPAIDFDDSISVTDANEQVDAPPQSEASEDRSVLLTGSEFYYKEFNQTLQFANSWTVGFWAKHNGGFPSSSMTLIDISNSGGFSSGIFFAMDGLGQISFSTGKTAAAGTLWAGVWNYPFNDSDWHHFAFSWDGSDIDMHIDGVYTAASSTSFDGRPGTMADDLREITYGAFGGGAFGEWEGSLGHLGIWDTDLTPAECLEIANRGHAANLNYNVGNYVSAANLQHYYRPGWVRGEPQETGREDKALNAVNNGTDRHMDGTVGVDDDNVVLDAPPHP